MLKQAVSTGGCHLCLGPNSLIFYILACNALLTVLHIAACGICVQRMCNRHHWEHPQGKKIILILKKTFFPNQVIKPFLVFFQLRKQVYQERALENNNKENYSTFTYIYTSAVKPLIANGIFKTKLFQGSPWHRHHYKVLRDVGLSYNLLTIFFGDVFPRQRVQFPGTTLAQ